MAGTARLKVRTPPWREKRKPGHEGPIQMTELHDLDQKSKQALHEPRSDSQ